MKKILSLFIAVFALFVLVIGVKAAGINDPDGVPLYVIIEVNWNGLSDKADWAVWGEKWNPEVGVGSPLTSCTNCLDANYEFTFKGNTVQFDEVFVDTVEATPQVRHVVLHDNDGDGTYTGSLSAWHYLPWRAEPDGTWPKLYFDRLDYELTFNEDGDLTNFHYLQYEHKKL